MSSTRPPAQNALLSRRAIVDAVDIPTIVVDANRDVIQWNVEAGKLFEFPPSEAIGRPARSLLAREPWGAICDRIWDQPWHESTRQRFEMEYPDSIGRKRLLVVRFGAYPEPDGRCGGVISAFDDTQGRESVEALKLIMQHAPVGMFIVQDGTFVLLNPVGSVSLDAKAGDLALQLVHPDDRVTVREAAVQMLKGLRDEPYVYRSRMKDGGYRFHSERVVPITFRGERAAFGMFEDVSDEQERLAKILGDGDLEDDAFFDDTVVTTVSLLTRLLETTFPAVAQESKLTEDLAVRIAREVGIRRLGQVSLAAKLHKVGIVTLPTRIAQSLADGELLPGTLRELGQSLPQRSADLISIVHRLQGVAALIRLEHTPMSDMPLEADEVILGANALGAASDYVDLAALRRIPRDEAVTLMSHRAGQYHKRVFDAVVRITRTTVAKRTKSLKPADLRSGMVVNEDILNILGVVLVKAGSVITSEHVQRLGDFDVATSAVEVVDDRAA